LKQRSKTDWVRPSKKKEEKWDCCHHNKTYWDAKNEINCHVMRSCCNLCEL